MNSEPSFTISDQDLAQLSAKFDRFCKDVRIIQGHRDRLVADSVPLRKFWDEQAEWSRAVFGSDQERGPVGPLKHLIKEANEALKDPTDLVEYCDCLFLIFDATRRAGFTLDQLVQGCFDKLALNKTRKWNKPTSDEPVEHDRTGE